MQLAAGATKIQGYSFIDKSAFLSPYRSSGIYLYQLRRRDLIIVVQFGRNDCVMKYTLGFLILDLLY